MAWRDPLPKKFQKPIEKAIGRIMRVYFSMDGVGDDTDKQICRQIDKAIAELQAARAILMRL